MNAASFSLVIVENQPLMLSALSSALASDGMNVTGEVSDSRRVFEAVQEKKPQILLFSVGKPSLPDLERVSALRHEFPNLLILALVSGDYRGQERMALDYGAHRVLSKAVPREELLSALRELSHRSAFGTYKEVV